MKADGGSTASGNDNVNDNENQGGGNGGENPPVGDGREDQGGSGDFDLLYLRSKMRWMTP